MKHFFANEIYFIIVLMGHSLISRFPPHTPPFPLITCSATSALQATSHWSPFFSPPFLICSAVAISSYMSHWSLSAELSVSLSFTMLPVFSSPACVVWCHILAVRDLFLPTATEMFVICGISLHRARTTSTGLCGLSQLYLVKVLQFTQNSSPDVNRWWQQYLYKSFSVHFSGFLL